MTQKCRLIGHDADDGQTAAEPVIDICAANSSCNRDNQGLRCLNRAGEWSTNRGEHLRFDDEYDNFGAASYVYVVSADQYTGQVVRQGITLFC